MKHSLGILASLTLVLASAVSAFAAPTKARTAAPRPLAQSQATQDFDRSDSPLGGKLEMEPNFGFAFLGPKDVNSVIRDLNDKAKQANWKSFGLSEIGTTTNLGFATTYRVIPSLGIGLGYNRMSTGSESSATVQQATLSAETSVAANLLTLETRITLARAAADRLELLAAPFVGMGFYSTYSRVAVSGAQTQEEESSAKGAVFGATLGSRYWFTQNFSAGLGLGYRYAKSGVLKYDTVRNTDNTVGNEVDLNGKKLQLDMSSFLIGTQLTLAL